MKDKKLNIYSIQSNRGNVFVILFILFLTHLSIFIITSNFLFDNSFYFKAFSESLDEPQISDLILLIRKYNWLNYFLIPLLVFLKALYTTLCIKIGIILNGKYLDFLITLKAIILSSFVFTFQKVISTFFLWKDIEFLSPENISTKYTFSMLSIIGIENVNAQWVIYPLQMANLFEVFYVLAIAWLLSRKWNPDFFETLNIVLPSYGLGLLLWGTLVAFLTFQVS